MLVFKVDAIFRFIMLNVSFLGGEKIENSSGLSSSTEQKREII